MNAIAMLSRCRVRQDNPIVAVTATEGAVEMPYFAPDIEPFVADVHPLPNEGELAQEAARLGLTG